MSLDKHFEQFAKEHQLFGIKERLLLAVSGGVDSVVLAHLCKALGYTFSIAHVNFQLRGEESDKDEVFVRALGSHLGVPTYVKRFDTELFAQENKLSIQEAARNLRYDWFRSIISGASEEQLLLTAHHANDNTETVLLNLFKGTGIQGLTGIRKKNDHIRRPLLFATKQQILDYANQHKLEWRDDASNTKSDYTRNFIRLNIIPEIEKLVPSFQTNMLHNIQRFESILNLHQYTKDKILKKLIVRKGKEIHIPIAGLLKQPAPQTLLFEVLYPLGFVPAQCDAVYNLLKSETGKFVSTEQYRAFINRKWLIIAPLETSEATQILITKPETGIETSDFVCEIDVTGVPTKLDQGSQTIFLDAEAVKFPLILRRAKPGDYFYPFGMNKKKKINRFLTDIKIPLHQKEKVWVLTSEDRVVWVVGLRPDNRFKVTHNSQRALKFHLLPKDGWL